MLCPLMIRVFHCDDEPNYRTLVRVVLGTAGTGYQVVGEASDGRECLDLAPSLDPDVILLDVNMPGLGGIQALPLLRERLPEARIVALTTSWRDAWEEPWRSLGGDGYVEKPRDALALPGLLDAALAAAGPPDPLDVAEEMFHSWWAGDRERAWAMFAGDAEFRMLDHPEPLVGVEAARAHLDSLPEERREATARASRMLALDDAVVIEATAEIAHPDHRERFPVAWVLRVRDGEIRAARAYRSWSEAHAAAGLTAGVAPTGVREFGPGAGRMFSVVGRVMSFRRAPALVTA